MGDLQLVKKFKVNDGFFGRYEKLVKDVVLPYQEKALNDQIEGADKSHCIENFRMAAEKLKTGKCDGEFYGKDWSQSPNRGPNSIASSSVRRLSSTSVLRKIK